MKKPVMALAFLLLASAVAAQVQNSCTNIGTYCFSGTLYECVNGEPQLVEQCSYACENGTCVEMAIEPKISYKEPEQTKQTGSSDLILYMSVGIALFAIIFLFLRIRHQK